VFETDNLRKVIQKNAKMAAAKIEDRIRLAKDYLKRKQMASRGIKMREGVDSMLATQKEDHSSVNDFEVFQKSKFEKSQNSLHNTANPLNSLGDEFHQQLKLHKQLQMVQVAITDLSLKCIDYDKNIMHTKSVIEGEVPISQITTTFEEDQKLRNLKEK